MDARNGWRKYKKNIEVFERTFLRKIFGAMNENGTWRSRKNHELYQLLKETRTSKFARLQKTTMGWSCMEDDWLPKRALDDKTQGRRQNWRPRKRKEGKMRWQQTCKTWWTSESGEEQLVPRMLDKNNTGSQGSLWAVAPLEREHYHSEEMSMYPWNRFLTKD